MLARAIGRQSRHLGVDLCCRSGTFSAVFTLAQVSLIGPSFGRLRSTNWPFQAEVLFHHSNLRLLIGLERLLSKVIVTPRMHAFTTRWCDVKTTQTLARSLL